MRHVTGALLAAAVLAVGGAAGCGQGGTAAEGHAPAAAAWIALRQGRQAAGSGEQAGVAAGDDGPQQQLQSDSAMRIRAGLPPAGIVPTAQTAAEPDSVGALFVDGVQMCTASVVDSPGDDLLITAAHCIYGEGTYGQNITFVPGYSGGQRPYGTWVPERMLVDPRWSGYSDPDLDVGFIILRPLHGKNIQDVLGGNTLAIDPGYTMLVRVSGYPWGSRQAVTCVNWTSQQADYQLRFDCAGFPCGTSGSPWVISYDPATGTGALVGLIGGYQQGGDTSSVSYSPYFNSHVRNLYEQAVGEEP